jgi:excisionase family DNA binding protein
MTDNTPAADLLYGKPKIADFLGINVRAVSHLIETKRIPFFRLGKTVCARRSKVTEAMERLEECSA